MLKYNGATRAMRIAICIALFSMSPILIKGQTEGNQDSILLIEAEDFFEKEKYAEAIEKVNEATSGFIQRGDWNRVMDCQTLLVRVEYMEVLRENLLSDIEQIHTLIPDSLDLDKAISSYNIALIADEKGDIFKALKHYKAAIDPFKKHKDWVNLSWIYINLGVIYTQLADYARAKKYYNASAEIMLETKDTSGYNDNIYNLAENAFYQGAYLESENLFRQYQSLNPNNGAETYALLCDIKIARMELDSARSYLKRAEKWYESNSFPTTDLIRLNADILGAEGDLAGAISEMKKMEAELEGKGNIRERGKYYWKLADLYFEQKDWDNAQLFFDRSLQSFSNSEVNLDSISKLGQKKYLFYEVWIGDILIGISNVLKEKYSLNGQEIYKTKAKDCLDLALTSLDYKRSVFEDIESSFSLNKNSKALYEKAINTYLDWYKDSGLETELDKAFQLTQRHNAFVLRQQINERTRFARMKVDSVLKNQYFDLKIQAIEECVKLGKQYTKQGFEQMVNTETKLDSIKQKLAIEYPQLTKYEDGFNVSSVRDIQKTLSNDRAVIKYFEGHDSLYAFVITRKSVKHFAHKNVEQIKSEISQIRSILSNFNYEESKQDSIEKKYLKLAYELGNKVISKEIMSLPKSIKKITIIPSGSLTQISFEALIIDKKKSWKDPNHYLTNDFAISYNYFCKALTSPTINRELEKVLSYGLEYDEYTLNATKKISNDSLSNQIIDKFRSEEMGHLYFADVEADEVASMFDGVSFINEKATKQNFLDNVMEYDIIHLSAHSFVDYQYPSNSAIIFTKKDSLTDNLLRIKDVDRLTLDGQLFTLSACNTFFGKKYEGEGLSSLARSFIQSGAGSVVGSFWSVPDEISKSFMIRFYSKLKSGLPKDEALRATKIDFMTDDNLSSPLYRSPAYWSAWVVYGDTQSIGRKYNELLYLGIGLMCICMLLFIKFRYAGK